MCRGLSQASHGGSPVHDPSHAVSCELCRSQATMYCQADDAFLCRECDKWVHEANFLAKRHIRCILCATCHNLTQKYLIGSSVEVMLPSIVSLEDTREDKPSCDGSRKTLKTPFLFL